MEDVQESTDCIHGNTGNQACDKQDEETAVIDLGLSASELMKTILEKDAEIGKLSKKLETSKRQLEKANNYNEDLRKELMKLSSELHKYRNVSCETQATQVSEADIDKAYGEKPMPEWGADTLENSSGLSIAESLKAVAEAEMQSQQQINVMDEQQGNDQESTSEYVFDSTTGFYYHPATGYYWDPNSGLFYDYTTGIYYSYNDQTGEYEVHSRVDITGQTQMSSGYDSKQTNEQEERTKRKVLSLENSRGKSKKRKVKGARKFKKRKNKNNNDDNREAAIFISDSENIDTENSESKICEQEKADKDTNTIKSKRDESDGNQSESSDSLATGESELASEPESGELTSESSSSDVEMIQFEHPPVSYDGTGPSAFEIQQQDERAENYPPCIRVIVQASDHLTMGSLFIVTCAGGSIGREANCGHAIVIDDLNVSKVHAQIEYDYDNWCYNLTDKGSQNGTILNGNRLSESKSESNHHPLNHSDIVEIGSTKLLFHIHKGLETCEDCEPGQVQAKLKALNPVKNDYVVLSKEEKNQQRRKQLKNIKKKYGLQNAQYENPGAVVTNPDYCDKAHLRRKYIGSDPDIPKSERPDESRASVQNPISASNKGHKLLAKMGWKEGQGLGKTSTGIAEPINVEMRLNQSAGLGSREGVSLSLDNVQHAGKAKRWTQARQRYNKLQTAETEQTGDRPDHSVSTSYSQQASTKLLPLKGNVPPSSISLPSFQPASSPLREEVGDKSNLPDGNTEVLDPVLSNQDPYSLYDNTSATTSVFDSQNSIQNIRQWSGNKKSAPPKMSWVRGGTEQIGESDVKSGHVSASTDSLPKENT